ncbi:MAG: DUF1097 domain-containing protein [Gemmatimonadales bacterium]
MSPKVALSVSIALLGGVAAVLFLTQGLFLWAGFIAWAAFFGAGGDHAALKKTIAGNLFGVLWAWVALLTIELVHVGGWLWIPRDGIVIGLTVLVLGLASRVELLSPIPASIYGYAAMFAAASMAHPDVAFIQRLTGFHQYNPFLNVAVSMVGGAVFGLASSKLAGALQRP